MSEGKLKEQGRVYYECDKCHRIETFPPKKRHWWSGELCSGAWIQKYWVSSDLLDEARRDLEAKAKTTTWIYNEMYYNNSDKQERWVRLADVFACFGSAQKETPK